MRSHVSDIEFGPQQDFFFHFLIVGINSPDAKTYKKHLLPHIGGDSELNKAKRNFGLEDDKGAPRRGPGVNKSPPPMVRI